MQACKPRAAVELIESGHAKVVFHAKVENARVCCVKLREATEAPLAPHRQNTNSIALCLSNQEETQYRLFVRCFSQKCGPQWTEVYEEDLPMLMLKGLK